MIGYYPLTNPQKGIWYIEKLYPGTTVGIVAGSVMIHQNVDFLRLEKAINTVIKENDVMRMRLHLHKDTGEPLQYVKPYEYKPIDFIDFSFGEKSTYEEWNGNITHQPFELIDSELTYFVIYKINENKGGFYFKMHHLISDAWTMNMIVNEVIQNYSGLISESETQENIRPSYIEYIQHEQQYMETEKFIKDKEFWNAKFADMPDAVSISKKAGSISTRSVRKSYNIAFELASQIRSYCEHNKISIFVFYLTMLTIYVNRITSRDDITVGTPVLNRSNAREKLMAGMFVSTVPFRISIYDDMDFLTFARLITKEWMLVLKHSKYPYSSLLKDLREKDNSVDKLYNIVLSYQNAHLNIFEHIGAYDSSWVFNGNQTDPFCLHINERQEDSNLVLDYDFLVDAFLPEDIERIHRNLMTLTSEIFTNSDKKIRELEIIDSEEKKKILYDFNNTKKDFPKDKTVHVMFEEQVAKTPNNIAVKCDDVSLTYTELNTRSNVLAAQVREKGVRRDAIVGILMNRSVDIIVGMLAILKAGGAFLPIDPQYPTERIEFMLKDSKSGVLLTQVSLDMAIQFNGDVIYCDAIQYENPETYKENLLSTNKPEDLCIKKEETDVIDHTTSDSLAYVIYTSGSTGMPKGVMIEHKSLVNFAWSVTEAMDFRSEANVLSMSNMSFDIFIFEIIPSLLCGLEIVIASEEQYKSPYLLNQIIKENKINIIHGTPSKIQMLLDDNKPVDCFMSINKIIIGGEVFTEELLNKIKSITNARVFNGYGPTEATIGATFKELHLLAPINIGKPISNTHIYIVDNKLMLQPIGVVGELLIGGEGVSRGYTRKDSINAAKFMVSPFMVNETLYRTGDLACWNSEGELEYWGRADSQVKIKGYRIELGEIENRILQYPKVIKAAVVDQDYNSRKILCAYIVSNDKLNITGLRLFIQKHLPAYMVPSSFIQVSDIPLTPNGKIDRFKLREFYNIVEESRDTAAPTNEQEAALVHIWRKVLQKGNIGIDDNFFDMGGDSLGLISVISFIHKCFNVVIPISRVYELPTIKELCAYIEKAQKNVYTPIKKTEIMPYYPVSSAQKRIFTLMQFTEPCTAYNMPGIMVLYGDIDRQRFNSAWKEIFKRHEILRTSFSFINDEPVQKVSDFIDFNVNYIEADKSEINETVKSLIVPFDISSLPLVRVHLIQLSEAEHILLLDMHHIILDGTSVSLLMDEFNKLYNYKELSPVRLQYRDYCVWQKDTIQSENMIKQRDYWVSVFSGNLPVLNMPCDFERPDVISFEGDVVGRRAGRVLTKKLKKLASETGITLYMLLLSAFNVLLSKYTGQEDIIVGTPMAGRRHIDLENMLGMFVNTVAMRNYPEHDKIFMDFLNEVKVNAINAYENQDYQFEDLINLLRIKRSVSRNPLFDVMFVLQNINTSMFGIDGLEVHTMKYYNKTSKFDLLLETYCIDDDISFEMEYNTKLFRKETVSRLLKHYINILKEIVADPCKKIYQLKVVTKSEEYKILTEFNKNYAQQISDTTINKMFERQVSKTPKSKAVIFNDNYMTYEELNNKSNQLARVLRKKGVTKNSLVGLFMDRSIDMIVSVLGILKAGGAFVPIDPTYPEDRVKYMLHHSGVPIILTRSKSSVPFNCELYMLDLNDVNLDAEDTSNLASINDANDLIYVIYTSGSTGQPKGVILEHKNIVNLMNFQFNETNIDFKDRVLQLTTISFDVCYQEIFSALLSGGELYIADKSIKMNAPELITFINKNSINVIFIPPSYLRILVSENFINKMPKSVRHIIVAGEQMVVQDSLKDYLCENNVFLHNHYGPSETHVVTTFTIDPHYPIPSIPPIGKPISNNNIYILDRNGCPVPLGVVGEIYIAGKNVGKGYLNDPILTEKNYLVCPYSNEDRMYKTGDMGRWLPDGNIEFLGRIDYQVKVRGFRIELGEVECCLLNHPDIKEVVVLVKEDGMRNKLLYSYYVSDQKVKTTALRKYLMDRLPEYMVPSHFIRIDKIPLTPSGKADKRALLEIDDVLTDDRIEAPTTDIEKELVEIWCAVLNMQKISVEDNFFELGGDSLAIIQAQIRALPYKWNITTQDYYRYQTIKELANKIQGNPAYSDVHSISNTYQKDISTIQELAAARDYDSSYMLRGILLTGVTGFLGAHILHDILKNTDINIHCLIRKKGSVPLIDRLVDTWNFYFTEDINQWINKRVFIVEGDITKNKFGLTDDVYLSIVKNVDAVINSAALVKHYGNYSDFEKINVNGTKEIIDFAFENQKPLVHISTIGVSGKRLANPLENSEVKTFTEDDFYIGQIFDENVYIKSKFASEALIYEAMDKGLCAIILRIGNITGRYSDGLFQKNISENAFYNVIRSIIKLGVVSSDMIDRYVEFSPVDYCSRAAVLLATEKSAYGRVYHLLNHRRIQLKYLLSVLNLRNIDVKVLSRVLYNEHIVNAARDNAKMDLMAGIIHQYNSENDEDGSMGICIDSMQTYEYLRTLGFEWPQIDDIYIEKLINYMKNVRYL